MGYVMKGNEIVITDTDSDILICRGDILEIKEIVNIKFDVTIANENRPYPMTWQLTHSEYKELDKTGSFWDGNISIEISELSKPIPIVSNKCLHPNKKVVRLISSAYWYCPDCKADLGDVK